MSTLSDRTKRLHKRVDVLMEKKRKYDEQVIAKERSLAAVDATQQTQQAQRPQPEKTEEKEQKQQEPEAPQQQQKEQKQERPSLFKTRLFGGKKDSK